MDRDAVITSGVAVNSYYRHFTNLSFVLATKLISRRLSESRTVRFAI